MAETAANPVLAELWRGDGVESCHRGAWALTDTDGRVIDASGNPGQPIYARSSSKSLQALPLVVTGAADAFDVSGPELAVTLSSHNGEDIHVEAATSLLARAGLTPDALGCGPQAPAGSAPGTEGRRIVNNCSGKHAGFLATTVHLGADPSSYLELDSPIQRLIEHAILTMTGADPSAIATAIDGCSAPTYVLPLDALATGLGRVANAVAPDADHAAASERLVAAAAAHPEYVAGTAIPRFDTAVMATTGGRLFCKGGAEAVQTVGVVGAGVGLAVKVDDGSSRSLSRITLAVLARHDLITDDELAQLTDWTDPIRRNWAGVEIGRHIVL